MRISSMARLDAIIIATGHDFEAIAATAGHTSRGAGAGRRRRHLPRRLLVITRHGAGARFGDFPA